MYPMVMRKKSEPAPVWLSPRSISIGTSRGPQMNRARKLKRKIAVMNRRGASLFLNGTTLSPSAPVVTDIPME